MVDCTSSRSSTTRSIHILRSIFDVTRPNNDKLPSIMLLFFDRGSMTEEVAHFLLHPSLPPTLLKIQVNTLYLSLIHI